MAQIKVCIMSGNELSITTDQKTTTHNQTTYSVRGRNYP